VLNINGQQTTEATRDTIDGDDRVNLGNSWTDCSDVQSGGFCRCLA
jgi:hypothetical protein